MAVIDCAVNNNRSVNNDGGSGPDLCDKSGPCTLNDYLNKNTI